MVVKHVDPPTFEKIPESDLYANASVVSISPTTEIIQIAGQSGRHPTDGSLPADIEGQIENVLKRFTGVLEHIGAKKTDITSITYYVANDLASEQILALGPKFGAWMEGNRPAAVLVKVAGFLNPAYLVEVSLTVVKHGD